MKRNYILLLLAVSLFFSTTTAASANSDITLRSVLTCDDKNVVTKQNGDIITIIYTLKNATHTDAEYFMLSHTNEFYYDNTFFEYVDGSASTNIENINSLFQRWGDSLEYSVSFNGMPMTNWKSALLIGTFQLKVIAAEDSSTIYSKDNRRSITSESTEKYTVIADDLTVIVDAPVSRYAVEVKNYIADKKIVLVYTNNNEISFVYHGKTMYDVTSKGYKYEDRKTQASDDNIKVYALVVDAVQDGTLDDYKNQVTAVNRPVSDQYVIPAPDADLVHNLNHSGETDIGDVIAAYGVFYADSCIYPAFMKHILRADVNNDKCVDNKDIRCYTDAFINARNKSLFSEF